MTGLSTLLVSSLLIWQDVSGQMLGEFGKMYKLARRTNNNNNGQNTSGFNIVNGQILTPGLAIIDSPQPFTPEGGDFLQVALDISGDGKLPVAPKDTDDPLTQIFNITLFLTSNKLLKNFTISNFTTTTSTPPLANILIQEPSSTVKHVNWEWPDCLVGDGNTAIGTTARGDYNISIHQNYRLNGSNFYTIFNLPISVSNSIPQFPSTNQLLTNPVPGPLNTNGGRMSCAQISNPMMNFTALVNSVNNPPGQPYQDIQVQTSQNNGGGGRTIGSPGKGGGGQQIGQDVRISRILLVAVLVVLGSMVGW